MTSTSTFSEEAFLNTVHEGFTIRELHAAFDLVKDADNWKNRINETARLETEREIKAVEVAVTFFTGSVATVTPLGADTFRIRAAGYYATVGA
jgi:hypothetical protein